MVRKKGGLTWYPNKATKYTPFVKQLLGYSWAQLPNKIKRTQTSGVKCTQYTQEYSCPGPSSISAVYHIAAAAPYKKMYPPTLAWSKAAGLVGPSIHRSYSNWAWFTDRLVGITEHWLFNFEDPRIDYADPKNYVAAPFNWQDTRMFSTLANSPFETCGIFIDSGSYCA